MTLRQRLAQYFFPDILNDVAHRAALAAASDPFAVSGSLYGREEHHIRSGQQVDSREAWIRNPYAHRIIDITTAHILGRKLSITSSHPDIDAFIHDWWEENEIDVIVYDLIDELLRSGEWLFSLQPDPHTHQQHLIPIPGHWLQSIATDPHNYRRELGYHIITADSPQGKFIPHASTITSPNEVTAVYFAINRPIGSPRSWGGILTPVLPAIERYNEWLSDRSELNHSANKYAWDVTAGIDRIAEVEKKFLNGIAPGSVYVHTPEESITAVSPQTASWDARHDGQAMRQAIATGSNTAMHMLGDVTEGSRAGAREAALPTYRIYAGYQNRIANMLKVLVKTATIRAHQSGRWRRRYKRTLPHGREWGLTVQTADLTREDNAQLATAANTIINALSVATEKGWIDETTATEWLFRFAGENYDPDTLKQRLKETPTNSQIEQAEAEYLALRQQEQEESWTPFTSYNGATNPPNI